MHVAPSLQNVNYLIDAFKMINSPDTMLIMIVGACYGKNSEYLNELINLIGNDNRIKLLDGLLGSEHVQTLMYLSDAGISLNPLSMPSSWILEMVEQGKRK
jgi:hypothetical protein